jgi:hypothetical protein
MAMRVIDLFEQIYVEHYKTKSCSVTPIVVILFVEHS